MEAGLLLLVMLLISPESRNPHYQLLAPLYATLAVAWSLRDRGSRLWGPGILGAIGALGVLLPSQGLVGRENATVLNAWGVAGFGSRLLFVAGTWALARSRAPVAPTEASA
jgi:hypothetical protein